MAGLTSLMVQLLYLPEKLTLMLSASSNIVLCRYIHQITACSLYIKKVVAYEKNVSLSREHPFYQALCGRKGKAAIQCLSSGT